MLLVCCAHHTCNATAQVQQAWELVAEHQHWYQYAMWCLWQAALASIQHDEHTLVAAAALAAWVMWPMDHDR